MGTNKGPASETNMTDHKLRKKRQRRLIGNVCYEYTQSTSLQGIPYMTKKGLNVIERAFWILTFIASLSMCGYLIGGVWTKWQTSPVIVTVSEQLVSVTKVPLPSITICPQAKCKSTVYNFTDVASKLVFKNNYYKDFAGMTSEVWKWLGLSLLCDMFIFTSLGDVHHNSTAIKHMNEIALDYNDIFAGCQLKNKTVRCENLFSKVLTASGVCYTMNVLAADEILRMENIQTNFSYLSSKRNMQNWSLERGYFTRLDSHVYPARGQASDVMASVSITLKQKLDDHDTMCHGSTTGFQIHVQHPADLPQTSLYTHTLKNNQQAALALSFSIMNTAETLRKYHPEIRQCYFPGDRQLKYFKIYTAKNCRLECLSNFTFDRCGCVPFHMPHNSSQEICTVNRRICMFKVQGKLAQREDNEDAEGRCRCLEACNSITYDAYLMRNKQEFKTELIYFRVNSSRYRFEPVLSKKNSSEVQYSTLKIFYKSPQFISMRRSELFGVTDFLANCGGLLGLFLGFSFLSLVEIIYFFTLRVYYSLKKDRIQQTTNTLEESERQNTNERF